MSFASDAAGPRHRRHPTGGNHTAADSEDDIPDGAAALARLFVPLLVVLLLLLYLGRRSGGVHVPPRRGSAAPEPGINRRQPGFQPFLQLIERR